MNFAIRLLLRADSGYGIGHGHATRVEAIARAAVWAGGDARIVARPLAGHRPPATDLPDILWLDDNNPVTDDDVAKQADAVATLHLVRTSGFAFDLVVIDHYDLGPEWERTIRATGATVLALDDFPGRPHAANQVVELLPEFVATPGRLAGLKYLPMDRAYDLPVVIVPKEGIRVVVTFGASDPTGHTILALDALNLLDESSPGFVAHADIVVGAAHPAPDAVSARVLGVPRRSLHRQLPSLVPLIANAHVVLTAAGNAMTEAVAAGRRTVAVVTADNQMTLADALAAAGVVHLLPMTHAATAPALAQALQYVAGPGGHALEVALARRPVDAFGADRLLAALVKYARLEVS